MLLDLGSHSHWWGPGTTEGQCGGSWSHEEAWSVPETGPCLVPPGREGAEIAWLLTSSCSPDFCSCLLLAKPSWKPADLGAGDRQPVVSPPPLRAEQGRVGAQVRGQTGPGRAWPWSSLCHVQAWCLCPMLS